MTEMQKQIIRGSAVDEVKAEDLTQRYLEAKRLENRARKPLDRIFQTLEEEIAETYDCERKNATVSPALERYRDRLEKGDHEALERLTSPERTSLLDQELDELNADEETLNEVEFYGKLLEEQYDFLTAAIDKQANLEMLIRHQMETSKMADEKVEQAASLLIGPLNHGEIENLTGENLENFIENTGTQDKEMKQITEEILTNMRLEEGNSPEARFRTSIDKTKEYWSQSSS